MAKTSIRIPMSVKMRAKQFMMFDAMKGLTDAIAEQERMYDFRKEFAEDRIAEINESLTKLQPGDNVTVEYFCKYESRYKEITGVVEKIDLYWKTIYIGECSVDFFEISNIICCQ